jgi:Arc/MetJ family transcription regulator
MRTNIEIDDELLARAMQTYGLRTKREAVEYALQRLVAQPLDADAARALRGSGWDADLAALREGERVDAP